MSTLSAACLLVVAPQANAAGQAPPRAADHESGWTNYYGVAPQAYDGGFVYKVERRNGHNVRVVRQTRAGRPRTLVAALRTATDFGGRNFLVNAGQVALDGEFWPRDRGGDRNLPSRDFVAVARNGRFELVHLEPEKLAAGVCGETATLVNIRSDGSTVFTVNRREGLGGRCQVQRLRREVKAVTPDGAVNLVTEQTGAWGTGESSLYSDIEDAYDSAYKWNGEFQVRQATNDLLVNQYLGGELRVTRIGDGSFARLPYDLNRRYWEMTADGRTFSSRFGDRVPRTTLFSDPFDMRVGKPLNRPGMISYFHLCDDKLVEVSRRGRRVYREPNRRWWRVTVRDLDGNWLRTLPHKLRRGTNFLGCDELVARFVSPTGGRPVMELGPAAAAH